MTAREIENLHSHLFHIANSFIGEISADNSILALHSDDKVVPEPVCNHHLIELLSLMNPAVFIHYCESLFTWLAKPENGYSAHPFTLDSYTIFCERDERTRQMYREGIAAHQLADGSIPVYTAMFDGGDFFSTLWATKILINYDKNTFEKEIELALCYLEEKYSIGARSLAQRGFFLFLLLRYNPDAYGDRIENICQEVMSGVQDTDFSGSAISHINDMYLLEDLIEYYSWCKEKSALTVVEEKLAILFELDNEPRLPTRFAAWEKGRPQQPYFQLLLKSGVVIAKYLLATDHHLPSIQLSSHLHETYRNAKYHGLAANRELKRYKRAYDPIESAFRHYDQELKEMWLQSNAEYDKSIFLMMPFDSNLNFRTLSNRIKETCNTYGFKAFRLDDPFRSPTDQLWKNIELNMLSCRFGIAVHVAEKIWDKLDDKPRFFHNPNVAVEFGFMKSRGKKVLILKDEDTVLSSDLQGFQWRSFEIKNPDKTIDNALTPWLQERQAEINTIQQPVTE